MIIQHRAVAALVSLSLLAAAFATTAAGTSDTFPVGSYQHKDSIIILKPDGSFVGTTPKGEDWVKGTYTHEGKALAVVDTWEGDAIKGEDCMGKVGHYTWTKTAKVLTLHVVKDACEGRKKGTDGVAWMQIAPVAQ